MRAKCYFVASCILVQDPFFCKVWYHTMFLYIPSTTVDFSELLIDTAVKTD